MALRGALNHRKTRKLARLLGIPASYALGVMEALWHTTATQAPTGAIGRLSNEDIADQLGITENVDDLIAAIVEAGFLDESRTHRLIVHDWHVHSDNTLDAALFRKGQRYANGSIPRGSKLSEKEYDKLYAEFYARPAETLFEQKSLDLTQPEAPAVIHLVAAAAEGEIVPAPSSAAKRLPEPEPEPVPAPVPEPVTSPTPPLSRREVRRALAARVQAESSTGCGRALDLATDHVLRRCSITGTRSVHMHAPVWMAIESECKRVDKPPEDHAMVVAETMAANHAEYVRDGHLLQFRWSFLTFIEAGHWRNWNGWPIDHDKARQQSTARVGYIH